MGVATLSQPSATAMGAHHASLGARGAGGARSSGDAGNPVVSADLQSPQSVMFTDLADAVWSDITSEIPAWDKFGCHDIVPITMKSFAGN